MSVVATSGQSKPELWGGIECTLNRVGNVFRDQSQLLGHYDRQGHVEAFAALGLKKFRYPILWEHLQPVEKKIVDWYPVAEHLHALRCAGITPIAGLLHHGSGPMYTSLLDDHFAEKLAAYASQVAHQFPWLRWYTPVNEPLTTARFSGLYGHWYPHSRNEQDFLRMLVNQLKGVALAMQAIRSIQPSAKLIQTEDLCKVHSTALLRYQAAYENERRWLTYDLLCGRVDKAHFFWTRFIAAGVPEPDLRFFVEQPCPPDIIGCNYYVTSERFLDDDFLSYPVEARGGNGTHQYADTPAYRYGHAVGIAALLTETWERYHIPLAVTECHLDCTREEQARWFKQTWDACTALRNDHLPIEAVTAWSLTGAYDWNSLLTKQNGHYETGAFEAHRNFLRPTFLSTVIKQLGGKGAFEHPLLGQTGWWNKKNAVQQNPAPLLIIGGDGTLGRAMAACCTMRNIHFISLNRADADICDAVRLESLVATLRPWAVINAAGYVRVDEAENNAALCFAVNAVASGKLAEICRAHEARYLTFSSDLVFDGKKSSPYTEPDTVMPLNVYGASKAAGERLAFSANPQSLIVRTSAFFGPWDTSNFVYCVLATLTKGEPFCTTDDVMVSPTYVPDLVNTALDLFIDGEWGLWHISSDGSVSWGELARLVAKMKGLRADNIHIQSPEELHWVAKRPAYSVLQSGKGVKLPSLDNALHRYFANA